MTMTQVIHARSDPVGSVEFRRFPNYRIPVRISSDEIWLVPVGSADFRRIPDRNFTELTGNFSVETGPESVS